MQQWVERKHERTIGGEMYAEMKADAVNRITREVRKAIPYFSHSKNEDQLIRNLIDDEEVKPEIENLIRIIIEEVKDEG